MNSTLFHEMAGFQLNCRSKPDNHFSRYNNKTLSALKLINDFLMKEEEDEEDKACMVHDSLALQATERSFYNALHNLDENTLNVGDYLLDSQLLSTPSEGYFGTFNSSGNDNFDYNPSQNNFAGDCLKMVKKKRNVADTFFDDDDNNGESEEQSQAKKTCSRR